MGVAGGRGWWVWPTCMVVKIFEGKYVDMTAECLEVSLRVLFLTLLNVSWEREGASF